MKTYRIIIEPRRVISRYVQAVDVRDAERQAAAIVDALERDVVWEESGPLVVRSVIAVNDAGAMQ